MIILCDISCFVYFYLVKVQKPSAAKPIQDPWDYYKSVSDKLKGKKKKLQEASEEYVISNLVVFYLCYSQCIFLKNLIFLMTCNQF